MSTMRRVSVKFVSFLFSVRTALPWLCRISFTTSVFLWRRGTFATLREEEQNASRCFKKFGNFLGCGFGYGLERDFPSSSMRCGRTLGSDGASFTGLHGSPFMRSWWWEIARVNVRAEMAALGGFLCTCHDACVCVCVLHFSRLAFFFFFSLPFSSSPPLLSCSNGTLREKTKKNCWCVYVFKFSSVVGVVHWCAWLDRFCDLCEIMRGCFVLEHLSALWEIAYNFFYFAFVVDWRAKIKRSSFCWNKWVFLHSLYCVKCGFFFFLKRWWCLLLMSG